MADPPATQGPLSGILQDLHLIGAPLDVLDTRAAVQLGVVYNYLPLMIFPLFVALDRLDPPSGRRRKTSAPTAGGRSAR